MTFHLPVIRPPAGMFPNPFPYYNALAAVKVSLPEPTKPNSMVIEVEPANFLHPEDPKFPVSTVFALTAGFVRYVSPGEIQLRVWPLDFYGLAKSTPQTPRANRIVLSGMVPHSVEQAIREQIATMTVAQLEESWLQKNTGTPPSRTNLEQALFTRFVAKDADIFVTAGTPLGSGSPVPTTQKASVTLEASFEAAGASAVPVVPEELLDTAGKEALLLKFTGHPLLEELSRPIQIHFTSRFLIWDNTSGASGYKAFAHAKVELFEGPTSGLLASTGLLDRSVFKVTTGSDGRIDETHLVAPRALIYFRYATKNTKVGTRWLEEDLRTDAHKARVHVDGGKNIKDYRAKYEIAPKYQDFTDEQADHESDEKYNLDRGNVLLIERSLPTTHFNPGELLEYVAENVMAIAFNQRHYLKHMRRLEATFKADKLPDPGTTFTVMFEGDSWLNYPFAYNDIYGHLDQIFWSKTKQGITYNRIPLQHFGDRSDHMFVDSANENRQWDFTRDFLDEYDVDLIVLSAGGNDVAEPGISVSSGPLVSSYFVDGLFNPNSPGLAGTKTLETAEKLMRRSFAALLKNHPWSAYLNGTSTTDSATMSALLQPLLVALGRDFGPDAPFQQFARQEIGTKVIANFPSGPQLSSDEETLLFAVFDEAAFDQRYQTISANWEILLQEATARQIPVVAHTYGYPLFNEEATSLLGLAVHEEAGPWFTNRFKEAGISDRRIRSICLKYVLDQFVVRILKPLKDAYPVLDYVDTRNLNSSTDAWRDEMHLHGDGFRKVAKALYDTVQPKFTDFLS